MTAAPPAHGPAPGRLMLVPTPLDFGIRLPEGQAPAPLSATLPMGTLAACADIHHWIVENAKSARAFIKRLGHEVQITRPVQEMSLVEMPRQAHKDPGFRWDASALLAPALAGHDVGLLSEAGLPAVADPGSDVVRAAHVLGLQVLPLPGPSALLLALAASGMNGQAFRFAGYLPVDVNARAKALRALEADSAKLGQTQLFIEVPHRNAALLDTLLSQLQPATQVLVAGGLATASAWVRSGTVAALRQRREGARGITAQAQTLAFAPTALALPCVFGLLATA